LALLSGVPDFELLRGLLGQWRTGGAADAAGGGDIR